MPLLQLMSFRGVTEREKKNPLPRFPKVSMASYYSFERRLVTRNLYAPGADRIAALPSLYSTFCDDPEGLRVIHNYFGLISA